METNNWKREVNTGVVVLNYLDYKSSIKCLESIHRCHPLPRKIVVVDNNSPNDSLRHLEAAAADLPHTSIILAKNNGGFSAGHNLGITALRSHGCENFVLATSDTEIFSEDLFGRFEDAVSADVGVIGPDIEQPNCAPQNPSLESLSLRYCFSLLWFCWGRPGRTLWRRLQQLRRSSPLYNGTKNTPSRSNIGPANTSRPVYKLHGSFFMLTSQFIDQVGLLDEDIFMFGEEDLISWRCERAGLKRLILSNCLVHHINDSSIESAHGQDAGDFVLREEIRSGRLLRKKINFLQLFRHCLSK